MFGCRALTKLCGVRSLTEASAAQEVGVSGHHEPAVKRFSGDDFRAHVSFLVRDSDLGFSSSFQALIMVCCRAPRLCSCSWPVACVVYLMGKLRSIFRPFLWALFLVMVLTPAVCGRFFLFKAVLRSSVESVLSRSSQALLGALERRSGLTLCL